jgi:tetratricopeptide (TPR) repeat protein
MLIRLFLASCLAVPTLAQTVNDSKPASAAASTATHPGAADDSLASAQALLKKGKFTDAAAAFKSIVEKNPSSAEGQVGLVRSLLRSRQVDEAEEAGKKALAAAPTSSAVHAVVGDVAFRAGKFADAETEYRAALRLDSNSARGTFGIARMLEIVSMHKSARAAFAKAHELDPADEQIYEYWIDSLSPERRVEALKEHAGEHPSEETSQRIKLAAAEAEKKTWVLAGEIRPTEIKMQKYGKEVTGVNDINRDGPMSIAKGYGLQVKFNDGPSAVLLLDTGAGGITIGHKLAEKAGVVKIADSYFGGIGDRGPVQAYIGRLDKIKIGDLEFHNCLVEVSTKNDIADEAGLIGADVFEKFLVTLDFRDWKLSLAPLPKNPAATGEEEVTDRYVAPEMQSFPKFYRFGHDILVPVVVSDKTIGNFILDTGADLNSVSPKLASKVTKASAGDYQMKGVSGNVQNVLTGNKVILQFAKMRIESHDLPVFATDNISAYEGTEIAGFIGIRTLTQMKMTIDYRDGLVNLQVYDFKKAQE